jgi:hypothetical protein
MGLEVGWAHLIAWHLRIYRPRSGVESWHRYRSRHPAHPPSVPVLLQDDFKAAADEAGKIATASGITNDEKLEMYSLFKQASEGDCGTGAAVTTVPTRPLPPLPGARCAPAAAAPLAGADLCPPVAQPARASSTPRGAPSGTPGPARRVSQEAADSQTGPGCRPWL